MGRAFIPGANEGKQGLHRLCPAPSSHNGGHSRYGCHRYRHTERR
jgi:hypothetical protein